MEVELAARTRAERSMRVVARSLMVVVVFMSLAMVHATLASASSGVWNWGATSSGTTTDVPVAVGLAGASEAASGFQDSLALLGNQTVMAWGRNTSGQLGNGTTTNSNEPVAVKGLSEVLAISAGDEECLALLKNGTVKAWGSNHSGQLGNGTTTNSDIPVAVTGLSEVVAIASSFEDGLALLKDGKVMAWGNNDAGQLGNGTTTNSDIPVEVTGLSEVVAISAGAEDSLALLKGGTVVEWGRLASAHESTTAPVAVAGLSEVTSISGGAGSALALLSDGTVKAWGENSFGQLGDGTVEGSTTPVTVSGLSEVKEISGGFGEGLALLKDGTARAWGRNVSGQLGDGGTANSDVPVVVKELSEATFLTGGFEDALAIAPLPVSPAPEFGRCVKVAKGSGQYKTATCTSLQTGGSYEWTPGVATTGFTSTGGAMTLETVGKTKVACKAEHGAGKYTGAKALGSVVIAFTSCESQAHTCTTTGAEPGELLSNTLEGALGWEKHTGELKAFKVALDLRPVGGGRLLEFNCGATSFAVEGSVLVNVKDDASPSLTTALKYSAPKGKQKPEGFEGEPHDVLMTSVEAKSPEQTGLAVTVTQRNAEKVEVNAFA